MTPVIRSARRLILIVGRIGLLTLLALAAPSSTSVITQTEVAKLLGRVVIREGELCYSSFGVAVAIGDDTAIVGDSSDCELDWYSGAAYIFVRYADGNWEEQAKLLAYNGGIDQGFGRKVDIDGDTVIVGDWEDDLAPANSAYIFVRDELGNWTLQAELTPSATSFPDYYGWDIAINGDTALVGAPGDDSLYGEDPKPGRVYVYVRDSSGIWTERAQLFPSDSEPSDGFGLNVDLDGDTAIATRAAGSPTAGDSGPVYVFTRDSSGLWTQQAKLERSLLTIASQPGPVALDGDTAVMLTNWEPSVLHGLVHVFVRDSQGNWAEESVIDIGTNYEEIALDGDRIVVTGGGAADVYTRTNSSWSLSAKLAASDLEGHEHWYWFGRSVGMDDDTVLVGGPRVDESETPGVYVFELGPPAIFALDDGPYVLDEGGALAEDVNILDNDTDPEGDQLTPVVVGPPAHAAFFQVMPDGTFDYTHDGSETTSDTFTYRASDGVNESEIATVCLEITPVNDAPEIRLIGEATITIIGGVAFEDPGATARDAEDGDISANIVVGGDTVDTDVEGTYLITYNVTDSEGSAATQAVRTVIVEIDDPPVITLIGPATLTLQVGDTYNEQGATAEDAEDGDLTDQITIDNAVDTGAPGTYTVTYTVEDTGGNQAQAQRSVIVEAAAPPPASSGGGGGGSPSLFEVLVSALMLLAMGRRHRASAFGR